MRDPSGHGRAEVIHRLAARWRQENYFRFGRQRFGLDAHDSFESLDDDAERMVPNPAKEQAKLVQQNARSHRDVVANTVNAAMLAISTPEPGSAGIMITNQIHNDIHAPLVTAQKADAKAVDAYQSLPAWVLLGESWPGACSESLPLQPRRKRCRKRLDRHSVKMRRS